MSGERYGTLSERNGTYYWKNQSTLEQAAPQKNLLESVPLISSSVDAFAIWTGKPLALPDILDNLQAIDLCLRNTMSFVAPVR